MPSNHRLIHHTKPRRSVKCSKGITGSWEGSISTPIISQGVLLIWSLCSSWFWLSQQPWLVRKVSLWVMLSAREHVEFQHQRMPNVCSIPCHPSPRFEHPAQGSKIPEKGNCHSREENRQTSPQRTTPRKNLERKPFLQPGSEHPLCSWLILHHLIQIRNASKCYYTFFFENKNDNNWNKTLNEKTQRLK